MQARVSVDEPLASAADALVVPVFKDARLDGATAIVDKKLGGVLAEVLKSGEFKASSNEVVLFHADAGRVRRVLAIGLGDRAKFETHALAKYAGTAARYLGRRGMHEITYTLPLEARTDPRAAASFIVEGAHGATLDTTTYRTELERPIDIQKITILARAGETEFDAHVLEDGAERGTILGEALLLARKMALTPANDMTPTHMADQAKDVARRANLKFEALDEAQMKRLGMGSLLGVSAGSDQPAKMIVLRYNGDPSSKEVLALVGKGITFDSGGISIKPADRMHEMKYDMSGGAGVIAAMQAIGLRKPKINVLGIVPASENLPGHKAMKPGDILRAMNGKTIEVINTDAEGRLILADALCYANKLGATKIVDAATLTGACVVALGHAASGAMSNDDAFLARFLDVAKKTGERYWPLPLYSDYSEAVKSEIADLRNSVGRPGGSVTAGAFLKEFVGTTPWIHLDIAGTAYLDNESAHSAKGPTGVPVRAFLTLAEELAGAAPHTNGSTKTPAVKKRARTGPVRAARRSR